MSAPSIAQMDSEVCREAQSFTDIFYDAIDRKREKINYLFCQNGANIVWNGNPVEGVDDIVKFINTIPETNHTLVSLDAQKLPKVSADATESLLVTTAGAVVVGGGIHSFTESIILSMEDGKYKIRSARFRYVD